MRPADGFAFVPFYVPRMRAGGTFGLSADTSTVRHTFLSGCDGTIKGGVLPSISCSLIV